MKATCFITGSLLVLASCGSVDSATSKLSGVYADYYTNEFAKVYDTVEVRPLSGKDMYQIYYRSRIESTVDGKKMPAEFKTPPPVIGSFDPERKVIVIDGETAYSVDMNAHTLTKGNGVFKRIK